MHGSNVHWDAFSGNGGLPPSYHSGVDIEHALVRRVEIMAAWRYMPDFGS
jgi:hypothetical protein